MKQLIFQNQFNDKNFWQMFDLNNAVEFFMPHVDFKKFKAAGGKITIEDSTQHDRYMRNIEIWAEHEDTNQILLLLLSLK
jgi:hypothetical protein